MIDSAILRPLIYDAYGHSSSAGGDAPLLGFNAELLSPLNLYLLGNGARAYSARIRRFLNPDALSPFGYGGTNAYAYCSGDPINRIDPTGQSWKKIRSVILGREGRVVASANGMSGVTGGSSGQLSKAALENIGKMENGRHFVGVMKVSDKRIDLAISNQLGHVGSDVEKRLPKGVTYQIGSGMKAVSIPVPLEGLHEIGRRAGGEPFDITGHAMMVKMLSGREKDYVGFSGLKRGETTLRLKWTSRTLNPRHASFMTRRHLGIPGQGRDYILHPSYQQKIIRQFESFEVITDR